MIVREGSVVHLRDNTPKQFIRGFIEKDGTVFLDPDGPMIVYFSCTPQTIATVLQKIPDRYKVSYRILGFSYGEVLLEVHLYEKEEEGFEEEEEEVEEEEEEEEYFQEVQPLTSEE